MSRIGLRSQAPIMLGLKSTTSNIGMSYMPSIVIRKGGVDFAVKDEHILVLTGEVNVKDNHIIVL